MYGNVLRLFLSVVLIKRPAGRWYFLLLLLILHCILCNGDVNSLKPPLLLIKYKYVLFSVQCTTMQIFKNYYKKW